MGLTFKSVVIFQLLFYFAGQPAFILEKAHMKEAENKVVTAFVNPAELRARQAKVKPSNEDIHVGPNTQLSGGFSTNGMMIVDGRVDGADINAERLVLSHIGELEGTASVQRAEISGVFSGTLVASDEVVVRPTARISGTVRCQKLVIHRGARIECSFSCNPENPADSVSEATSPSTQAGARWVDTLRIQRDRHVFAMGAGSVLALIGAASMLFGLKALLS
jgi:cytoskeletal protein CcmA (bactofilin family)